MNWLALIFVFIILLNISPTLAIVAGTIFCLYILAKTQHPFQRPDDNYVPENSSIHEKQQAFEHEKEIVDISYITDLTILRLELNRLHETNGLSKRDYNQLTKKIDALWEQYLAGFSATPDNEVWNKRKNIGWNLLASSSDDLLIKRPWPAPPLIEPEPKIAPEVEINKVDRQLPEVPSVEQPPVQDSESPDVSVSEKPAAKEPPIPTAPLSTTEETEPPTIPKPTKVSAALASTSAATKSATLPSAIENYAWERHESGPLERALKTLSGWHSLIAPFLVQNIGWFLGIFCFVAGSIFMVSYTSGYAKNLTVFLIIFIYTLFLLWGGYQLRSKRPELKSSSNAIFILSILLIPLATATAARLLVSSEQLTQLIVSVLLIAIELPVLYYAVTIVSALMDRSLQNYHPKIYFALASAQLAIPFFNAFPYWPLLALLHLILIGVLVYGVRLFVRDWLHSIFIERRKAAYYAAGTLVYAALVSFVHLAWGAENIFSLPSGYPGPFLMLLCGLLFYVDSNFKKWTQDFAYLSRFSFFVYGLSILALFLVYQSQTASIITLLMAIGIYAFVVWNYQTLTPLYLFFVCCFWLYGLLFLQHLSIPLHFLAALPGLLGLYALNQWAISKRRSEYLALIGFRTLYSLLALLTIWSLLYSAPGLLAFTTSVASCCITYFALKSAPERLFLRYEKKDAANELASFINLLSTQWFYTIPLLAAVSVFYSPLLPGLTRESQSAVGLLLLSAAWTHRGLRMFFMSFEDSDVKNIEMLLNSALIKLIAALFFIFLITGGMQIALLTVEGAIILWLTLKLRLQWLFYGALILWGASGAILKSTYFPGTSTGLTSNILALAIWFLLWRMDRPLSVDILALEREQAQQRSSQLPSFPLLWIFNVNPRNTANDDA